MACIFFTYINFKRCDENLYTTENIRANLFIQVINKTWRFTNLTICCGDIVHDAIRYIKKKRHFSFP